MLEYLTFFCAFLFIPILLAHGYIAQWLERLTADQQVPGSNPGVPFLAICPCPLALRRAGGTRASGGPSGHRLEQLSIVFAQGDPPLFGQDAFAPFAAPFTPPPARLVLGWGTAREGSARPRAQDFRTR